MSDNLQRYFDHLHGTVDDAMAERVPEVVILSAPADALEMLAAQRMRLVSPEAEYLVDALEEGLHLGWAYNGDNEPVFNGRKCCAALMDRLASMTPGRLEIPSDHYCPECKTLYRIQWPAIVMEMA